MVAESHTARRLAKSYADVLVDLVETTKESSTKEPSVIKAVEKDFTQLRAMVTDNTDLRNFVSNPSFSLKEKDGVFGLLMQKASMQDVTRRFVRTVVHNNRLAFFPLIIEAFMARLAARRGALMVKVYSARALAPASQDALHKAIGKLLGCEVRMENIMDASLLGGVVIQAESRMFDASLKGQLAHLKRIMQTES